MNYAVASSTDCARIRNFSVAFAESNRRRSYTYLSLSLKINRCREGGCNSGGNRPCKHLESCVR